MATSTRRSATRTSYATAGDTFDVEALLREIDGGDAALPRSALFAANDVTPVTGRRVQPLARAA